MLVTALNFSFQASGLAEQLKQSSNNSLTGYWRIQADKTSETTLPPCFLAMVRGRIVFSGAQQLSWHSLLATLQRYNFPLRSPQTRQALEQVELELSASETLQMGKYISRLSELKLFSQDELLKTLRLKILSDLDCYAYNCSGQADFVEDTSLYISAPIVGFDLDGLFIDVNRRNEQWMQLQKDIPSRFSPLIAKQDRIEQSKLSEEQKQKLQRLVVGERSLNEIAHLMSRDELDVAKALLPMFQEGLIVVKGSEPNKAKTKTKLLPEVFIVDDSPVLVQQFRVLVEKWGYQVNSSSDALNAVDEMAKFHPSIVFLDINMPGASGFDLIKQIRRQSSLASVPLVLLTAEKTLSNQWRANWANCKFLSKPTTTQEVSSFRAELYALLQEMIPIEEEGTLL
jgi:CheY-like chemotaxis protein